MLTIGPRPTTTATPEQCAALLELPSATLSDVLGPGHVPLLGITPLRPGWRLAGPALTVQLPPGDNLGMHVAVSEAQPGDVLLVQQGQASRGAPVGEIMALAAQARGAAGIVLDGPVRDRAVLCQGSLPVFANGRCPQACGKTGPAWIQVPISFGGTWVHPGDIVVADDDGVVIVPVARIDEAIAAARARMAREQQRIAGIRQGAVSPTWLAEAMRAAGVVRL